MENSKEFKPEFKEYYGEGHIVKAREFNFIYDKHTELTMFISDIVKYGIPRNGDMIVMMPMGPDRLIPIEEFKREYTPIRKGGDDDGSKDQDKDIKQDLLAMLEKHNYGYDLDMPNYVVADFLASVLDEFRSAIVVAEEKNEKLTA